jgi:hypothetical protein
MDICVLLIDTVHVLMTRLASTRGLRGPGILLAWAVCVCTPVAAQTILNFAHLGGVVRIVNTDMAVLESSENRTDIPCKVVTEKPEISFDMRFHETYRVIIPLRDLAGTGDQLRMLMRIIPAGRPDDPIYMVDRFTVPAIEEEATGEATLPGGFTMGPGHYKVDWLMRDRRERVCSSHWEVEARPSSGQQDLPLSLGPHTIAEQPRDAFREIAPVERASADELLHVKLLVNFSPANPADASLKPWDVDAVVAILRGIAREPQIGRFSIVAFNMQEQRIIYREDNVDRIDLPALGDAVSNIKLGTVDFHRLQDPQSDTRFLTNLLTAELGPQNPTPDAIIITGPKLMLDKRVPQDALKEAGSAHCPIFYLNYNFNPRTNPWRDTIGSALRVYKGLEYTITLPRDLGSALGDMMLRMKRTSVVTPTAAGFVENRR